MSPIKAALPKGMGEKKLESKWRKKCYFDGKDPDVWNRSFHLVIFQPSSFPKNFPASYVQITIETCSPSLLVMSELGPSSD